MLFITSFVSRDMLVTSAASFCWNRVLYCFWKQITFTVKHKFTSYIFGIKFNGKQVILQYLNSGSILWLYLWRNSSNDFCSHHKFIKPWILQISRSFLFLLTSTIKFVLRMTIHWAPVSISSWLLGFVWNMNLLHTAMLLIYTWANHL